METKKCKKCDIEKSLIDFYYHKQRKCYANTCRECNSNKSIEYLNNIKENDIVDFQIRSRACELTRRSKLKGLPYEKKMYSALKQIYIEQNGLCFYTKQQLNPNGYQHNDQYCFVIDRIIPDNGYVVGNMVFCCNAINKIKSDFTIEELKWWVSLLD